LLLVEYELLNFNSGNCWLASFKKMQMSVNQEFVFFWFDRKLLELNKQCISEQNKLPFRFCILC